MNRIDNWAFKAESDVNLSCVNFVGIPYDGTACYRKGTKEGPSAIREAFDNLERYSPYLDKNLDEFGLADHGDIHSEVSSSCDDQLRDLYDQFFTKFSSSITQGLRLITVGGEHSISYAPIKSYLESYNDLIVIHLDAHADLRDGFLGNHFSHASVIRRSIDHFKKSHELIQYGIRSGTEEEFKYMKENKTICNSRDEFFKRVEAIPASKPIYLTLDLDYFDPGYLPGTGTPEAGGEDFHSFISLIKILENKHFVGADVVELSPIWDPTGSSNCMASKVIREIAITLKGSLT